MNQNPFSGEFPIGRFSGQCASCNQPLRPGQVYYAVIWQQDDQYVRKDFDETCWQDTPADALGAWRAKVPVPQAKSRPRRVPARLLMSVFERLGETDGAAPHKLRFVLALLLLRRRLLKLQGTDTQAGCQVWHMRRVGDDATFDVVSPTLSQQDTDELAQELADLLAGLDQEAESV